MTHATRNDLAAAIRDIEAARNNGETAALNSAIDRAAHLATLPASKPRRKPDQGDWRTCDIRTAAERWAAGGAAPNTGKKSKRGAEYHRVDVTFADGVVIRTGTYDADKSGTPDTASCVRFARQKRMTEKIQAEGTDAQEQLKHLSRRYLEIDAELSRSPDNPVPLLREQQQLEEQSRDLYARIRSEGDFVWTLDGWRRVRVVDIPDVTACEPVTVDRLETLCA